MVVKTTPPEATVQLVAAGRRGSAACTGVWRSSSWQRREGAEELVVQVVAVGEDHDGGVLHGRVQDDAPGVEGHGQALARALGVPDHAHAPVAGVAAGSPAGLYRPPLAHARGLPCWAARSVSSTATLTAWNWW